ncbi:minor teichoic acid biosynthesis protein GgaB [Clostridia bacterium]|nr:minor teichoic acid biosynthesis protein GgaB [Clostridia bacterium]
MKKKTISCIIPVYNAEKYLVETVQSVINQSIDFLKNIELILVNDGSSDSSEKICKDFFEIYPNNIIYILQENAGVSAARNSGIDAAKGEYIFFLDADDTIDMALFERGVELLEEYNGQAKFVSFPVNFFGAKSGQTHPLAYRFEQTRLVDTDIDFSFAEQRVASCLFRREVFEKLRFDTKMTHSEDAYLVSQILSSSKNYIIADSPNYNYRKEYNGTSAVDTSKTNINFYKKLFLLSGRLIDNDLLEFGKVRRYTQFLVMYDLQWFAVKKIPQDIKDKLPTALLLSKLKYILQYIDDDIIRMVKSLNHWQKIWLLKTKYGYIRTKPSGEFLRFYINGEVVSSTKSCIYITAISEYNNTINIVGRFNLPNYDGISVCAKYGNDFFDNTIIKTDMHDSYFLGEKVSSTYHFEVNIPLSNPNDIQLFYKSKEYGLFQAEIHYAFHSRIKNLKSSFAICENCIIYRQSKMILTVKERTLNVLKVRFERYLPVLSGNVDASNKKNIDKLSNLYLTKYKDYSSRNIWLFFDRIDRGDDNSEHLFRYCASLDDGIEKYFIVSKDSPDFERIKQYGNVVDYGSDEHIVLLLFAKVLAYSDFAVDEVYPFETDEERFLCMSLSNHRFMFLQHGIIKDDMSKLLSRMTRNLSLFLTSAIPEYESINCEHYAYAETDTVKLLGLPRYDALENNPKKKIIIMPTWRSKLSEGIDIYNADFKDTLFFKGLNDLLSDGNFVDEIEKLGYEIILKMHPRLNCQLSDFAIDPRIIVADNMYSYSRLFGEGSLVITDYSSAVFDFAYLRKPVIYYHYDLPNLPKGYFDYERDGFGEIVDTKENLLKITKSYLKKCNMKKKYLDRIDIFFAFSDKNNCKRTYEAILDKAKSKI